LHEDMLRLESEGSEDQAEEAGAGGTQLDIGVGSVAGVGGASLGGAAGGAASGAGGIGGWMELVRAFVKQVGKWDRIQPVSVLVELEPVSVAVLPEAVLSEPEEPVAEDPSIGK
jgi:hypothetical protein